MLDSCQYIVLQIAPAYSVVQYNHSTKWVSISNTICHFRFYDICHTAIPPVKGAQVIHTQALSAGILDQITIPT